MRRPQDRFTVMDVWIDRIYSDNIDVLRNTALGSEINKLKYGAVYYPRIETILDFVYDENAAVVTQQGGAAYSGPYPDSVPATMHFISRSGI